MPETFVGPWRVWLKRHSHYLVERVAIDGAGSTDGRYPTEPGYELSLEVNAPEWTIDIERLVDDAGPTWGSSAVTRRMRFELPEGLTVSLESTFLSDSGGLNQETLVVCTSLDPTLHPGATENPYDFTYSG